MDPSSGHMYYYNTVTGKTQWSRPTEMGAAPHATGWYGRGAAGNLQAKYDALDAEWLKRKARKQAPELARTCPSRCRRRTCRVGHTRAHTCAVLLY